MPILRSCRGHAFRDLERALISSGVMSERFPKLAWSAGREVGPVLVSVRSGSISCTAELKRTDWCTSEGSAGAAGGAGASALCGEISVNAGEGP